MDKYKKDRNSYTFPSASDKFESGNLDMNVGQSVNFVRGSQSLSTRVLKVEKQIDYPIEQTITVGEEKIKGNTQEIKEEIVDANQNIDIATELANLSKAITDGYGRVQQLIMQSISQYRGLWYLDQHDAPNDPTKWTINTDYTAFSAGDVVAYATAPFDQLEPQLPVASDYNTTGLFRAKQGGGLLYDSSANAWYVDTDFQGSGGIDETQLAEYLTRNQYVTQKWLTDNGYLKLSSPLTGYQKPSGYSPITATDTLLSAIGKLEANFGNYVDLTTNQTVGGVKTFTERILSQKDVVAYAAADDGDLELPVTGYSTTGLVRIQQGGGIIVDSSGIISIDPDYAGGGGVSFTPGAALELTSGGVLNVLIGTTSGTVCAGNDSRLENDRPNPYPLSWSGFSNGSYDGSSVKSFVIPNNTNQLTNGAGFITGITKSMVMEVFGGTKNSSYFLDGSGNFSIITTSDISGLSTGYVTINTAQTVTGIKTFSNGWQSGTTSGRWIRTSSGNGIYGMSGSSISDLVFNQVDSSTWVKVTNTGNVMATGDVVAYSDGSSLSDFVSVATTSSYGLVKYDGSTIGKNSSGQLYVINGGGSGGGSIVSWGAENSSYHTAPLTVDGVTKTVCLSGHFHSWSSVTDKPSWIGSNKPSYSWSEINSKPNWITSSKPSYSWSEINSRPNVLSTVYTSGSGNVVTAVSYNGSTITVTKGNVSGGSSWDGGSVSNNITISNSSAGMNIRSSGSNPFFGLYRGSTYWQISVNSGGSFEFYYGSSRRVYFANTGNLWIQGTLTQNSDMRLKTVLSPITGVLEIADNLDVFRYRLNYDVSKTTRIGMSAQQVKIYYPELVFVGDDGNYSMDYVSMSAIAIQGLKELYARFRPVESKVKMLEQQVRNLQLRLDNAYREIFNLKQGKEEAA